MSDAVTFGKYRILVAVSALVTSMATGSAMATPTNNNDTIGFLGASGQLTTTLINPYDGQTVTINGQYYINAATYDGLAGTDTLSMTSLGDAVFIRDINSGQQVVTSIEVVSAGDGDDIIALADNTYTLNNMVILGGSGNDILWSNRFDDTVIGSHGDDIINGGPGSDTLYGQTDNDRITGGEGDDEIDGGDNDDIAFYSGLFANYQIFENSGIFTITDLMGTDGTDTVINVETFRFANGSYANGQFIADQTVPEPAALGLFGLGLTGLGLAARRRRTA